MLFLSCSSSSHILYFHSQICSFRKKRENQNLVRSSLQKMHKYKTLNLIFMMLFSLPFNVKAQTQDSEQQNLPQLPQTVHPSKVVVIVVLSTLFALTFLLLLYVKFCRVIHHQVMSQNPNFQGLTRSWSRVSGIDRQVVETLPFFKFSSLKGSKEGLECIVCLSKFEDAETLRLLPKCKHAFHINCIDKWFERHSTCPLCRSRVEAGDIKNFNYSLSSRFLRVPSNLTEDPNLEILVQREPSHRGSWRRGIWDMGKCKKTELFIDQGDSSSGGTTKWNRHKQVHVMNHKIVISDAFTRTRWSDLNSSDLLSLNSEMLNDVCSTRFSDSEKFGGLESKEENSFTALNPAEKRCMSEIANVPRFAQMSKRNERMWRVWLPIARRTVQWFAKQEELQHKPLASNV